VQRAGTGQGPAQPGPDRADASSVLGYLQAIVECLLAAHYSEDEILDYLTGPLGCSDADATAAVLAAR